VQRIGALVAQTCPSISTFPETTIGSACTSSFSRIARRSLTLRPAHSRGHQTRDRYPKASDISSPPCLLRVLPAGAVAGWASHPLEKRRLVTAHVDCRPSRVRWRNGKGAPKAVADVANGNAGRRSREQRQDSSDHYRHDSLNLQPALPENGWQRASTARWELVLKAESQKSECAIAPQEGTGSTRGSTGSCP